MTRHFLTLLDLSSEELRAILARATELKALHQSGQAYAPEMPDALALETGPALAQTKRNGLQTNETKLRACCMCVSS